MVQSAEITCQSPLCNFGKCMWKIEKEGKRADDGRRYWMTNLQSFLYITPYIHVHTPSMYRLVHMMSCRVLII